MKIGHQVYDTNGTHIFPFFKSKKKVTIHFLKFNQGFIAHLRNILVHQCGIFFTKSQSINCKSSFTNTKFKTLAIVWIHAVAWPNDAHFKLSTNQNSWVLVTPFTFIYKTPILKVIIGLLHLFHFLKKFKISQFYYGKLDKFCES